MTRLPLSASFRWRTDAQKELASRLRRGEGVVLAERVDGGGVDVALASRWQQLWDVGAEVLPLAYGSAKGNAPEAAATLLLNHLTRTIFGEDASTPGIAAPRSPTGPGNAGLPV